jgi:hypothetical protein
MEDFTKDPGTKVGRIKVYVPLACSIAPGYGVKPSQILSLGYRESWLGFAPGYLPHGPCGWADNHNGYGLFQIDKRYHPDFVASEDAKDPAKQMTYACKLLQNNRKILESSMPYLREEIIDRAVFALYNASFTRVKRAIINNQDVDSVTTGKDYSKYIFDLAEMIELIINEGSKPNVTNVGNV